MIGPGPSDAEKEFAYLAVELSNIHGYAPRTITKKISACDRLPTPKGGKGHTYEDRRLARVVLKSITKDYSSPFATSLPLTAHLEELYFRDFLEINKNDPVARMFHLVSLILRVSLCRGSEILYSPISIDNVNKLITLEHFQVDGSSIYDHAKQLSQPISQTIKTLIDKIDEIEYWSFLLQRSKTDQAGESILIIMTKGDSSYPILERLLDSLLERCIPNEILSNLPPFLPLFAIPDPGNPKESTVFSLNLFNRIDTILASRFNDDLCRITTHSRRKGGASDLLNLGTSLAKIRILGRWSNGVLNHYLRMSIKEKVKLQNKILHGSSADSFPSDSKFKELAEFV